MHAEGCRAIRYDQGGVMATGSGEISGICPRGLLGCKVDHGRLRTIIPSDNGPTVFPVSLA